MVACMFCGDDFVSEADAKGNILQDFLNALQFSDPAGLISEYDEVKASLSTNKTSPICQDCSVMFKNVTEALNIQISSKAMLDQQFASVAVSSANNTRIQRILGDRLIELRSKLEIGSQKSAQERLAKLDSFQSVVRPLRLHLEAVLPRISENLQMILPRFQAVPSVTSGSIEAGTSKRNIPFLPKPKEGKKDSSPEANDVRMTKRPSTPGEDKKPQIPLKKTKLSDQVADFKKRAVNRGLERNRRVHQKFELDNSDKLRYEKATNKFFYKTVEVFFCDDQVGYQCSICGFQSLLPIAHDGVVKKPKEDDRNVERKMVRHITTNHQIK